MKHGTAGRIHLVDQSSFTCAEDIQIYHMSNRPERGKKERGEGNIILPLLFSNLHRCVI